MTLPYYFICGYINLIPWLCLIFKALFILWLAS
jgi:hypothetical protein